MESSKQFNQAVTEASVNLEAARKSSLCCSPPNVLERAGLYCGLPHFIGDGGFDTVSGRAVCDRRTIHVHDLASEDGEYPLGSEHAKLDGHRTKTAPPFFSAGT